MYLGEKLGQWTEGFSKWSVNNHNEKPWKEKP